MRGLRCTLPLAPFASGATDELLDDSVNGVTTQADHSKGDIVVTGNELVDNGTFDTDTTGWTLTDGTLSHSTDKALATYTTSSQTLRQDLNLITNLSYVISFTIHPNSSVGAAKVNIFGGDFQYFSPEVGVDTNVTLVCVAGSGIEEIAITTYMTSGSYTIDNISVTLVDTSYQAIADTTANDLLTNTDKFQVIDYVTRQDVILLTKTGYKTVTGIHTFDDTVSNDDIASAYDWSKLGNGLYNDGTEEVIISGIVARDNAGAYHPVYNGFGTVAFTNTSQETNHWYITDFNIYNVYDTFNPSNTRTIGGEHGGGSLLYPTYGNKAYDGGWKGVRPDGKFYDKIYYESNGGLIFLPTYSKEVSKVDLLNDEMNKLVSGDTDMSLEMGVETVYATSVDTTIHYENPANTLFKINTALPTSISTSEQDGILQFSRNGSPYKMNCRFYRSAADGTLVVSYIGSDIYTVDDTIEWWSITIKSPSLLTQGKALSTDVIVGNV